MLLNPRQWDAGPWGDTVDFTAGDWSDRDSSRCASRRTPRPLSPPTTGPMTPGPSWPTRLYILRPSSPADLHLSSCPRRLSCYHCRTSNLLVYTSCISATQHTAILALDALNHPRSAMSSSITSATSETADQLSSSLSVLSDNYAQTTPPRVKLIDTFLLFCLMSGVLQFAYRVLVSSYPYNAFVGG